ncbi:unnamed protein product [Chondrus crispus]|uniref:C4-dicarboxylate transporter/malic acid transport protein n=1 Tax=Chondrus crispus TaxID=2769 RepID=R7QM48_CHOCR|nr:unnamed protein product [Chondrus crispus]CDF38546.1 unnamed protein product [Chondrus crispus]|eukprot:XP_005718439.1 unnamed protein product [Chondrus crispus]
MMDRPSPDELRRIPRWRRFVVQWDISHNAVALAFFAFTGMWQTAALHFGMIQIPRAIWYTMYFVSCLILSISALIYLTRAIIYPRSIIDDFNHKRLINFFFMPVMIGALCILTTPLFLRTLNQFIVGFYVLGAYQVGLALYLYGDWLFGLHPTNFIHPLVFMQTIGFFLLANIGASAHLVEHAFAMLSVGCLFWLLVFITNFQHLSPALDKGSERPQPTFFLFIAPPAQAALAFVVLQMAEAVNPEKKNALLTIVNDMEWPKAAQAFLYIDLFLYLLMFRLFPTFWTQKFSVSWWAYIFPLSAAASSVIWRYKVEEEMFWGVLAVLLGLIACVAMIVVSCFTVWALGSGRTPNNPRCLDAYYRYYVGCSSEDMDPSLPI